MRVEPTKEAKFMSELLVKVLSANELSASILEHGDRPDLVLFINEKKVGVELVRFSDTDRQNIYHFFQSVQKGVNPLSTEEGLFLSYNGNSHEFLICKKEKIKMKEAMIKAIKSNDQKLIEEYFSVERYSGDEVAILEAREGGFVGFEVEDFKKILEDKVQLSKAYRKFDELWILIHDAYMPLEWRSFNEFGISITFSHNLKVFKELLIAFKDTLDNVFILSSCNGYLIDILESRVLKFSNENEIVPKN